MKEQIQELVRQAEGVVTNKMMTGRKQYTFLEEDLEKFVESVVKECIEQIITGPNGPAYYAVEAAVRIKKHFGVEE